MAVNLSFIGGAGWQFFDDNGDPLSGGKIYTYVAGTTTPLATYTSRSGNTPNTNPIILDAAGRTPQQIWSTEGVLYKYVVKNSNDVTIRTWDDIGGSIVASDLAQDLANTTNNAKGDALIGFRQSNALGFLAGATPRTINDKMQEFVSIKDFGSGTDVGALLQAAINSGATYIVIPDATNWTWTTTVTIPELWRGRIVSHQSKDTNHTIVAQTGHNNPCIDAQGALFVEIEGVNVFASDATNAAPACFIVFARMPSGASSSNHRMVNNLIEGQFYYCCIYNAGGEELFFENNYVAIYATTNTINYRTSCIVHTLNENAYFSPIVTKAARTNAVSTSAIKHVGDVVKNFNIGGSALHVGFNTNDITFDLTYGYTPENSYFLSLEGYFDGIRLGVDRVETFKSSPIVYAPNPFTAGLIEIYRGAYRRSGIVNPAKSAILIGGTTSETVNITVSGAVSWTSSFGGEIEDIYVLNCSRKATCDVSLLNGGLIGHFNNSIINVAALQSSYIVMGQSANLTAPLQYFGNKFWFFFEDTIASPSHSFVGGTRFSGDVTLFNAKFGSYVATASISDSASLTDHAAFINPNGTVGTITTLGSATAYNTSSDYRLKKDVMPMTSALDKVMSLRPVTFTWVADNKPGQGFIAHELQDVCPDAVTGEKDALDKNGEPRYQGVDTRFLVAMLTAAIQEQQLAIIELQNALRTD